MITLKAWRDSQEVKNVFLERIEDARREGRLYDDMELSNALIASDWEYNRGDDEVLEELTGIDRKFIDLVLWIQWRLAKFHKLKFETEEFVDEAYYAYETFPYKVFSAVTPGQDTSGFVKKFVQMLIEHETSFGDENFIVLSQILKDGIDRQINLSDALPRQYKAVINWAYGYALTGVGLITLLNSYYDLRSYREENLVLRMASYAIECVS